MCQSKFMLCLLHCFEDLRRLQVRVHRCKVIENMTVCISTLLATPNPGLSRLCTLVISNILMIYGIPPPPVFPPLLHLPPSFFLTPSFPLFRFFLPVTMSNSRGNYYMCVVSIDLCVCFSHSHFRYNFGLGHYLSLFFDSLEKCGSM